MESDNVTFDGNTSVEDLYGDIDGDGNLSDTKHQPWSQDERSREVDPMDLYGDLITESEQSITLMPPQEEDGDQARQDYGADLDLYDDILVEENHQQQQSFQELVDKLESAMTMMSRLESENRQLQLHVQEHSSARQALEKNMTSLLLTARGEITRKEREIQKLRKQLRGRTNWNSDSVDSSFDPIMNSSPAQTRHASSRNSPRHNSTSQGRTTSQHYTATVRDSKRYLDSTLSTIEESSDDSSQRQKRDEGRQKPSTEKACRYTRNGEERIRDERIRDDDSDASRTVRHTSLVCKNENKDGRNIIAENDKIRISNYKKISDLKKRRDGDSERTDERTRTTSTSERTQMMLDQSSDRKLPKTFEVYDKQSSERQGSKQNEKSKIEFDKASENKGVEKKSVADKREDKSNRNSTKSSGVVDLREKLRLKRLEKSVLNAVKVSSGEVSWPKEMSEHKKDTDIIKLSESELSKQESRINFKKSECQDQAVSISNKNKFENENLSKNEAKLRDSNSNERGKQKLQAVKHSERIKGCTEKVDKFYLNERSKPYVADKHSIKDKQCDISPDQGAEKYYKEMEVDVDRSKQLISENCDKLSCKATNDNEQANNEEKKASVQTSQSKKELILSMKKDHVSDCSIADFSLEQRNRESDQNKKKLSVPSCLNYPSEPQANVKNLGQQINILPKSDLAKSDKQSKISESQSEQNVNMHSAGLSSKERNNDKDVPASTYRQNYQQNRVCSPSHSDSEGNSSQVAVAENSFPQINKVCSSNHMHESQTIDGKTDINLLEKQSLKQWSEATNQKSITSEKKENKLQSIEHGKIIDQNDNTKHSMIEKSNKICKVLGCSIKVSHLHPTCKKSSNVSSDEARKCVSLLVESNLDELASGHNYKLSKESCGSSSKESKEHHKEKDKSDTDEHVQMNVEGFQGDQELKKNEVISQTCEMEIVDKPVNKEEKNIAKEVHRNKDKATTKSADLKRVVDSKISDVSVPNVSKSESTQKEEMPLSETEGMTEVAAGVCKSADIHNNHGSVSDRSFGSNIISEDTSSIDSDISGSDVTDSDSSNSDNSDSDDSDSDTYTSDTGSSDSTSSDSDSELETEYDGAKSEVCKDNKTFESPTTVSVNTLVKQCEPMCVNATQVEESNQVKSVSNTVEMMHLTEKANGENGVAKKLANNSSIVSIAPKVVKDCVSDSPVPDKHESKLALSQKSGSKKASVIVSPLKKSNPSSSGSVFKSSPDKSFLLQSLLCGVETVMKYKNREQVKCRPLGVSGSNIKNKTVIETKTSASEVSPKTSFSSTKPLLCEVDTMSNKDTFPDRNMKSGDSNSVQDTHLSSPNEKKKIHNQTGLKVNKNSVTSVTRQKTSKGHVSDSDNNLASNSDHKSKKVDDSQTCPSLEVDVFGSNLSISSDTDLSSTASSSDSDDGSSSSYSSSSGSSSDSDDDAIHEDSKKQSDQIRTLQEVISQRTQNAEHTKGVQKEMLEAPHKTNKRSNAEGKGKHDNTKNQVVQGTEKHVQDETCRKANVEYDGSQKDTSINRIDRKSHVPTGSVSPSSTKACVIKRCSVTLKDIKHTSSPNADLNEKGNCHSIQHIPAKEPHCLLKPSNEISLDKNPFFIQDEQPNFVCSDFEQRRQVESKTSVRSKRKNKPVAVRATNTTSKVVVNTANGSKDKICINVHDTERNQLKNDKRLNDINNQNENDAIMNKKVAINSKQKENSALQSNKRKREVTEDHSQKEPSDKIKSKVILSSVKKLKCNEPAVQSTTTSESKTKSTDNGKEVTPLRRSPRKKVKESSKPAGEVRSAGVRSSPRLKKERLSFGEIISMMDTRDHPRKGKQSVKTLIFDDNKKREKNIPSSKDTTETKDQRKDNSGVSSTKIAKHSKCAPKDSSRSKRLVTSDQTGSSKPSKSKNTDGSIGLGQMKNKNKKSGESEVSKTSAEKSGTQPEKEIGKGRHTSGTTHSGATLASRNCNKKERPSEDTGSKTVGSKKTDDAVVLISDIRSKIISPNNVTKVMMHTKQELDGLLRAKSKICRGLDAKTVQHHADSRGHLIAHPVRQDSKHDTSCEHRGNKRDHQPDVVKPSPIKLTIKHSNDLYEITKTDKTKNVKLPESKSLCKSAGKPEGDTISEKTTPISLKTDSLKYVSPPSRGKEKNRVENNKTHENNRLFLLDEDTMDHIDYEDDVILDCPAEFSDCDSSAESASDGESESGECTDERNVSDVEDGQVSGGEGSGDCSDYEAADNSNTGGRTAKETVATSDLSPRKEKTKGIEKLLANKTLQRPICPVDWDSGGLIEMESFGFVTNKVVQKKLQATPYRLKSEADNERFTKIARHRAQAESESDDSSSDETYHRLAKSPFDKHPHKRVRDRYRSERISPRKRRSRSRSLRRRKHSDRTRSDRRSKSPRSHRKSSSRSSGKHKTRERNGRDGKEHRRNGRHSSSSRRRETEASSRERSPGRVRGSRHGDRERTRPDLAEKLSASRSKRRDSDNRHTSAHRDVSEKHRRSRSRHGSDKENGETRGDGKTPDDVTCSGKKQRLGSSERRKLQYSETLFEDADHSSGSGRRDRPAREGDQDLSAGQGRGDWKRKRPDVDSSDSDSSGYSVIEQLGIKRKKSSPVLLM